MLDKGPRQYGSYCKGRRKNTIVFEIRIAQYLGGQGKTGRKPASFHFRNEEHGGQRQWQYGVSGSGRMTQRKVREVAFTGAHKTLDEAMMGRQV